MADAREGDPAEPQMATGSRNGAEDPAPKGPMLGIGLTGIAQGLKILALLLFLLPWVTVSCAEQELVSLSGMDLATGSINVTNPMTGETVTPTRSNDRDLPILIAALLIVFTLVVGFVVRRALAANLSMAGLAAAAGLIVYSVLYRLPEQARESATADSAEGISESQIAELIRVDVAIGFWLTLAALTGAVLVTFMAGNRPGDP